GVSGNSWVALRRPLATEAWADSESQVSSLLKDRFADSKCLKVETDLRFNHSLRDYCPKDMLPAGMSGCPVTDGVFIKVQKQILPLLKFPLQCSKLAQQFRGLRLWDPEAIQEPDSHFGTAGACLAFAPI